MKTSHFRSPKLDPAKHVQVQISLGTPRYWRTEKHGSLSIVRLLAPPAWVLRQYREDAARPDRADDELGLKTTYEECYLDRLNQVGVARIRARLDEVETANPGKELVLLCFEDLTVPGNWCHRTMFAQWWLEQTGETIDEI